MNRPVKKTWMRGPVAEMRIDTSSGSVSCGQSSENSVSSVRANSRRSRNCSSGGSSGFSLLELILVLAILILLSALSIPSVSRSFQRQAVRKGADILRAAMGDARVGALRSGEIYAVYYTPGESYFSIGPLSSADGQSQKLNQLKQQYESGRATTDFDDNRLPRGVTFAGADAELDARALQAVDDVGISSVNQILFYPDGSAQNAIVLLMNEKGSFVQVILRGMTGTSSSRIVDRAEAMR